MRNHHNTRLKRNDHVTDRELESLLPLLVQLDEASDVRPVLVERFHFRKMIEEAKMMASS